VTHPREYSASPDLRVIAEPTSSVLEFEQRNTKVVLKSSGGGL